MWVIGHNTGDGRVLYWMAKRTRDFDYSFDPAEARCFRDTPEEKEEAMKICKKKGFEYLGDQLMVSPLLGGKFELTPG